MSDPRHPALLIAPVVADALATGRPVVALESTLISHGLPAPRNVEVALAAEAAVRAEGAVPATIAVRDGRLLVGLVDARRSRPWPRRETSSRPRATNLAAALGRPGWAGDHGERDDDRRAPGRDPGLRHGRHRRRPPRRRLRACDVSADLGRAGPDAGARRLRRSQVDPRRSPARSRCSRRAACPCVGFATDELPGFFSPEQRAPAPRSCRDAGRGGRPGAGATGGSDWPRASSSPCRYRSPRRSRALRPMRPSTVPSPRPTRPASTARRPRPGSWRASRN